MSTAARSPFPTNERPERYELEARGNALGGALTYSVPGLAENPEFLCFDAAAAPCTPDRVVRLSNAGPGGITLSSVRIETMDPDLPPGFVADPTVDATTSVQIPAGDDFDLAVRWCSEPDAHDRARLVVDSNDPLRPTAMVELRRLDSCPDGS